MFPYHLEFAPKINLGVTITIVENVMKNCIKILVVFVLVVALGTVSLSAATLKGQWDFDNPTNLTIATVGNNLILHGSNTAVSGIGTGDGAARISEGSYYGCNHTIAANGGGNLVNLYSFVMDVKVSMNGWYDWVSLYNTSATNADEADIWVSPSGFIGVGAYYSTRPIADDTWYRIAITHNSISKKSGTVLMYINGTQVTTIPTTLDGRWSLATNLVSFFADNAGFDHTVDVSKITVYDGVLTPAEVASLGGPGGGSPPEPPITFPYLQNVKTNGITIMWERATNAAGACSLVYGLNTNYGNSASYTTTTSCCTTIYKSVLTGLQPNTTYHYKVTTAEGYVCPDRTFTTAPSTAADFSFGVWGDSQDTYDSTIGPPGDPWEPAKSMMRTMVSQGCDFGIGVGDMEWSGFDIAYILQSFTKRVHRYLGASVPFYVAWGNHDGDIYAVVRNYISQPPTNGNFSFDYAGCHFLLVDVTDAYNFAWIESDLQAAQGSKFIFVFTHYPTYSERWYAGEAEYQAHLVPLLEQYGVDIQFSGHLHEYERGLQNGVYYVITGGGSWLDFPEVLVYDWPFITKGGYNDLGSGVSGGLVNEFVRVNITGDTLTSTLIAFNTDGSIKSQTLDTFTKTAGGGDTTAPTPNPMTWASVPAATGSTTIAMTATTGTDATTPVQYFFQNTTSGMSSHNSGWQTSTSWTDTGLTPSTTYSYQVQARDSVSPTPNVGSWSTTAYATTATAPLFSDGFESGNFTAGGWTTQNTNATVSTKAKYTGSYGAKLAGTTWMQKAVSTVGKSTIHVKYTRKTAGLDAGEYLYVEWSIDGSAWNNLETTQATTWALQDFTCGSGANNNANFRVRWRTNASSTTEYAYVDDVMITGQ